MRKNLDKPTWSRQVGAGVAVGPQIRGVIPMQNWMDGFAPFQYLILMPASINRIHPGAIQNKLTDYQVDMLCSWLAVGLINVRIYPKIPQHTYIKYPFQIIRNIKATIQLWHNILQYCSIVKVYVVCSNITTDWLVGHKLCANWVPQMEIWKKVWPQPQPSNPDSDLTQSRFRFATTAKTKITCIFESFACWHRSLCWWSKAKNIHTNHPNLQNGLLGFWHQCKSNGGLRRETQIKNNMQSGFSERRKNPFPPKLKQDRNFVWTVPGAIRYEPSFRADPVDFRFWVPICFALQAGRLPFHSHCMRRFTGQNWRVTNKLLGKKRLWLYLRHFSSKTDLFRSCVVLRLWGKLLSV